MLPRKHLICAAGALVTLCVVWLLALRPHHEGARISHTTGIGLRPGLEGHDRLTALTEGQPLSTLVLMYADLTGRELWPAAKPLPQKLDHLSGYRLSRWGWIKLTPPPDSGIRYHRDGVLSATEAKEQLEAAFNRLGLASVPKGNAGFRLIELSSVPLAESKSVDGRMEH